MKQATKGIQPNSIIVFNRDFTEEDLKMIPKDFCGDIVVHGNIFIVCYYCIDVEPDNLKTKGSIWCDGLMSCANLECKNLYVKGMMDAHNITCEGDIIAESGILCIDLNCKGNMICKGAIQSGGGELHIDGSLQCEKIDFYNPVVVAET